MNLTTQQALALHEALKDVSFREAIEIFFAVQADYATQKCQESMASVPQNKELATRNACIAFAYQDAFKELEEFSREAMKHSG